MANFYTSLFEYLKAQTGLSSLIGDRLYPQQAPDTANKPYIIMTLISAQNEKHMLASSGLRRDLWQFDTYALSNNEATTVSQALRDELDGFQRTNMGTSDPIYIRSIFFDSQREETINPENKSEEFIFRVSQDYAVAHSESIPTF